MIKLKKVPFVLLGILLVITSTVYAATPENEDSNSQIQNVSVRIGYDSKLYKAKLFFEDIRLKNAFTSVGKANVSKIFALRRMAEANEMIVSDRFDVAKELMLSGLSYIDMSTQYISDALMKKDNGRSRLALEYVSDVQNEMYEYITNLEKDYPDSFETESMKESLKQNVIDTMVLWVYISYKETILENPDIRDTALAAYESSEGIDGISIVDAVTTATLSHLDELGIDLGEGGVDAVTAATQEMLTETGETTDTITSATQGIVLEEPGVDGTTSATAKEPVVTDGTGVDGTTSATVTGTVPTDGTGVDATSSATVTPTPAPTGGVDATSSATVSLSAGSNTGGQTYYDDDEHEEHDDHDEHEEHEEHDDDDEHEEHDDDD